MGNNDNWVKSSLSFANGNCVEVSELAPGADPGQPAGRVLVRNSREPAGGVLAFTADEWQAFLYGVRNGEFDRFGQPYRIILARENGAWRMYSEGELITETPAVTEAGRVTPKIAVEWARGHWFSDVTPVFANLGGLPDDESGLWGAHPIADGHA